MKALTVWQPWASLIMSGAKRVETRSWATSYRGPLAIHAGKRSPVITDLPTGVILGTVVLIDCVPIPVLERDALILWLAQYSPNEQEIERGDYRRDRWAWLFRDHHPWVRGIPATGHQTLWNWVP